MFNEWECYSRKRNINDMFEDDEKIIRAYLRGGFEFKFFDACLRNLADTANPLRLNNFAYAMRELMRNVFARMAPDDEVLNASWYIQNEDTTGPTRMQRMKYAIQGWLSDETMQEELHLDITWPLKSLKQSIDDLSKYTHVGPETFDARDEDVDDMVTEVLSSVANVFSLITTTRKAVHNAVLDCVNKDMVQQFYLTTNPDVDMLASHHELENFWVTDIEKTDDENGCVNVEVRGSVDVRLQYGSDGDMRRGDGYETNEKFPFTAELEVSYKNEYGDIRIANNGNYYIDTDSFYE